MAELGSAKERLVYTYFVIQMSSKPLLLIADQSGV